MKFLLTLVAVLGFASPALAHWHEAKSEHFVVYADEKADDVKEFAELLERYRAALSLLTQHEVPTPSPSNRVTIFAVGGEREVRELAGEDARNVAGFYIPRAGASRAFVPDIHVSSGEPPFSLVVLLHEYAHHFLMSGTRYAMPRWLNEGAAEFFASSRFPRDGSIEIGRPAYHRAGDLQYAKNVTVEELLERGPVDATSGEAHDAFYAKAWALYHYLTFDEERSGEIAQYWKAIAMGTPRHDAAIQVFGDLDDLDHELDAYLRSRRMHYFELGPEKIAIGPISVRRLSDGMDAAMSLRIRSQRGVSDEQAIELLPEMRAVAAHFPDDAGVLAALAEAEHDAGNYALSIAAADRAIAIDPSVKNAYVQKGLSMFQMAPEADDPDAAYAAAMEPFSKLNKLENDHPLPLIYYYRSFVERGKQPDETARAALQRAAELAPFDESLAMNAAVMQAQSGNIALARYHLGPLAASPHGGDLAARARAMLAVLNDVKEGTDTDLTSVWSAAIEASASGG